MAPSQGSSGSEGGKCKRQSSLTPDSSEAETLEWIRVEALGGKNAAVAVFDKVRPSLSFARGPPGAPLAI